VKLPLGKDNPHEAPEEHFICPAETKPEELNFLILGGDTRGTIERNIASPGQPGASKQPEKGIIRVLAEQS
jgi:hypothetical protein